MGTHNAHEKKKGNPSKKASPKKAAGKIAREVGIEKPKHVVLDPTGNRIR